VSQSRSSDPAPGYRGALPPRNDWLARGWVIVVILIFLSLFVLDILNVPTRFLPEPTPVPTPVVTPAPSGSGEPSGSAEPTESAAPSGSGASEAPSPTP
jgi:hypothetical protein